MLLFTPLALALLVPPPASSVPEDPERLARALEAIDARSLASDLVFLADDELAGRDTPSEGLEAAALYLIARLERLGFQPAGPDGFRHHYPLQEHGLDPEACRLSFASERGEVELALGRDYYLNRMSHAYAVEAAGEVVSVGNGARDEFQAAEAEGAWVLVADTGGSVRRLQRYAQRAGAVGILLAETPELDQPYRERYLRSTLLVSERRVRYRSGDRSSKGDVPVLMLPLDGVGALFDSSPALWQGEFPSAGERLEVRAEERRVRFAGELEVANVAGFWPGRDPDLAGEVLIVSAHYDHVGVEDGEIFNGADDNASGTTGLLGVAEALAAYGPMRRSVLLLWVSGEEKGLWGSDAWSRDPVLPEGCLPAADLNIDMIGRTEPEELYLTPTAAHPSYNEVAGAALELCELEGFPRLVSQDADWNRSDHFNFDRNLGIPVAFLSAGEHADYHQPSDTAEKIDFDKMARVTRLVVRILDRIEDGPLHDAEPAGEAPGGSR
jgi:hypothetical protein